MLLTACIVWGAIFSLAPGSRAADPAGPTGVTVDDFESYTNASPKRLYETWVDGIGYAGHAGNGSGSMVGHDVWARGTRYTTIVETALIHGGKQSMPFYYYNVAAPFYSEIERTFAAPQDWTVGGVNALSLWFRGAASNAADPLYVAVDDAAGKSRSAVRGDPKAAQVQEWREWQIDLRTFTNGGVNLQGVKRLRLGVGARQNPKAGGTGILYVDDVTVGTAAIIPDKPAGSIVAWGSNVTGQATAPAGNDFIAIAAGSYSSLALRADGSLVAWGSNSHGQRNVPPGKDFRAIAAGSTHALAVRADGSLVAWGAGGTPPAGNDFVAVAAGEGYSIALRANGSLVGWGTNNYGQATPPAGNGFTAISAGRLQAQALRTQGSLVVWGSTGWYGDGVVYSCGSPPPGNDFIAVAGGGKHAVALKADGSIVSWGMTDTAPPTATGFIALAAGGNHDLALKADGSIVGWGRGDCGQATPPPGTGFIAIAAGAEHSLALKQE